jgi:predicted RNA-binding Zn ribbon-like protein
MTYRWQLPAPGDLELVRTFLNTQTFTGHPRPPEDRLPDLLQDDRAWQSNFSDLPRSRSDTVDRLSRLREDLRLLLTGTPGHAERLNHWLRELPLLASVEEGANEPVLRYKPDPEAGVVGRLLMAVIHAIQDGTWSRLKACPDCRVVFYDHTRSRTKVWCGMLAGGPEGRACGTIAKVTRYRKKQRARHTTERAED